MSFYCALILYIQDEKCSKKLGWIDLGKQKFHF